MGQSTRRITELTGKQLIAFRDSLVESGWAPTAESLLNIGSNGIIGVTQLDIATLENQFSAAHQRDPNLEIAVRDALNAALTVTPKGVAIAPKAPDGAACCC